MDPVREILNKYSLTLNDCHDDWAAKVRNVDAKFKNNILNDDEYLAELNMLAELFPQFHNIEEEVDKEAEEKRLAEEEAEEKRLAEEAEKKRIEAENKPPPKKAKKRRKPLGQKAEIIFEEAEMDLDSIRKKHLASAQEKANLLKK